MSGDRTPISLSRADVPANVRDKTPAEVETWINARLPALFGTRGIFVKVRVRAVNPLSVKLITSDTAMAGNFFGLT